MIEYRGLKSDEALARFIETEAWLNTGRQEGSILERLLGARAA